MLHRLKLLLTHGDLTTAMDRVRQATRARLSARAPIPIDTILASCLDEATTIAGTELLCGLAGVAGVEPTVLRGTDSLRDIFSAERSELDETTCTVLDRYGLGNRIQPDAYELMHFAETSISRSTWSAGRSRLRPPPQNEEEWLDAFMGMTICQFLNFGLADISAN